MRRVLVLAALLTLAIAVAACGSTNASHTASIAAATPTTVAGNSGGLSGPSSSTSPVTTLSAPVNTATATQTVASSTQPATVTTDTITTPDSGGAPLTETNETAGAECNASDLTAAAVSPNSAPGVTVLGFTLKNVSGQSCESGAYPGIGLISSAGTVDDVSTVRTTSDALGATPVTKIDLAPGDEMSFRITLHDSGSSSGACGTYSGVQIIAPNDTATMKVPVPDGPVQSCGSVGVSPVEPGANGTGQ